ncbi:MAG: DUF899 domain-containing protein [Solirubrobacteraceae bacterium]
MIDHRTASREQWLVERERLLADEKEHTRHGDELARRRRELPWVQVEKDYRLETDDGARTLADLFDGRSQLLVYHFMFGADYEAGDATNSSIADAVNGILPHLHARDVTMLFVSRAPIEKLETFKRRMGWSFPWASNADSDFDSDYGISSTGEQTREWAEPMLAAGELPPIVEHNAGATGTDAVTYLSEGFGFNAFALEEGVVYHTYSTSGRGVEFLMSYYPILDRTPQGRDEGNAFQVWLHRHDEYESE